MDSESKPIIGITTGDINGVGIELVVKAFSNSKLNEYCTPVLFGNNKAISFYAKGVNKDFNFSGCKDLKKLNHKKLNVFNCWQEEVPIKPGKLTPEGGKYAARSLEVAVQCLKDKEIDGLLTNPIHKKNIQGPNFNYTGHTPYLRDSFEQDDVAMMLCTDYLKVSLLTEHVPITDLERHINANAIISKTQIIHKSLIEDFGIDKPKIAVLALNPHAGDDGLVGSEEKDIILPAIEKLNAQNILAFGPYAADGFFARQRYEHFDCVLAMYHDQGLIPFKTLDGGEGVNFTAGLPVVRTSPDHGTAFDIAGKNLVDESSFLHALYQCIDVINHRKGYKSNTANKLQRGLWKKKMKKSKEDVEQD